MVTAPSDSLALARRMMAEGATAENAASFAGVPVSELRPSKSSSSRSSKSTRAPKVARRVRRSSFGALVAQSLLLVALYWILRAPDAISRIISGAANGLEWLREPVPIGESS